MDIFAAGEHTNYKRAESSRTIHCSVFHSACVGLKHAMGK